MDWFLYDRDLLHERVSRDYMIPVVQDEILSHFAGIPAVL